MDTTTIYCPVPTSPVDAVRTRAFVAVAPTQDIADHRSVVAGGALDVAFAGPSAWSTPI